MGPVIIEVDVQGARAIKQTDLAQKSIFLMPPRWEELEARLRGRHTETPAELERRLARAKQEMGEAEQYDKIVINDDLDRAVAEMKIYILENTK
jgi:guanylate kinase